ncbi:beta-galactoside alpha-2,6-sialyltransferase 1-like [Branchiostoma lanceolatum]|uniref:beta-galactoside alpha-2,6-sialyltransferase 1-like n=1 Tax=Branchiostoma lanceolatum TaxID=7740 RepID=UPI003454CDA7
MAEKTTLFAAVLCLCVLGNVLFSKYPITVTIGSPHANTTGMQFQLKGIGVPMVRLSNGKNVLPVMASWTYVLREDMYCKIKAKIPFSTITKNSTKMINQSDEAVLPKESLESMVHYNSCAVVSSSHGLRLHTYGREIDRHDAVLRFNCAPTDKFEEFVGNRTDIRLINTQIPRKCKKEFWNDNIAMFNNEIIVVRNLDTIRLGPHGLDLSKDNFHVFDNLKKYRKLHPNRTMSFIQGPWLGKDITAELRRFCIVTGRCNKTSKSPTTGMLGVVMMLHLCNWVRVYEMVPSTKDNTDLRYYYSEKAKRPVGGIHSYGQEREYIRTLSLTSDEVIDDTGVALLKGLDTVRCD